METLEVSPEPTNIKEAEENLEKAHEDLKDAVLDDKLKDIEERVELAIELASFVPSNDNPELREEIIEVREELDQHEESDEWLRNELKSQTEKLAECQSKILTLESAIESLLTPLVSETQILEPTTTQEVIEPTTITSESETLTEVSQKSAEESPAVARAKSHRRV